MKLSKETLMTLSNVIKTVNSTAPAEIRKALLTEVEDVDLFLDIIRNVQPVKAQKATKTVPPRKPKLAATVPHYDVTLVSKIFRETPLENILVEYTLPQLKAMYLAAYQTPPLSKSTKGDIANDIKRYFHQIERADAFM